MTKCQEEFEVYILRCLKNSPRALFDPDMDRYLAKSGDGYADADIQARWLDWQEAWYYGHREGLIEAYMRAEILPVNPSFG